jgi:hypothetical protein
MNSIIFKYKIIEKLTKLLFKDHNFSSNFTFRIAGSTFWELFYGGFDNPDSDIDLQIIVPDFKQISFQSLLKPFQRIISDIDVSKIIFQDSHDVYAFKGHIYNTKISIQIYDNKSVTKIFSSEDRDINIFRTTINSDNSSNLLKEIFLEKFIKSEAE